MWANLQSSGMKQLRDEFISLFREKGFGCVEGSKYEEMLQGDDYNIDTTYYTEAQIRDAEKGDLLAVRGKIETAKALGEGIDAPGQYRGYYKDPTRGDQCVSVLVHDAPPQQRVNAARHADPDGHRPAAGANPSRRGDAPPRTGGRWATDTSSHSSRSSRCTTRCASARARNSATDARASSRALA